MIFFIVNFLFGRWERGVLVTVDVARVYGLCLLSEKNAGKWKMFFGYLL